MATTAAVTRRLDRDIGSLRSFIDDLPGLADEWERLDEAPRVSLSLEWDHLMADYLTELDEYFRCGEMASGQRVEYKSLLGKLRELLPIIRRLNLYYPPVSLGE